MPEQADRQSAWQSHSRIWKGNRYVYAVVSRRSRGLSIGINLNPDKACNFGCIYCQVDRKTVSSIREVDLDYLADELELILTAERNGSLYEAAPFNILQTEERGIRDIAFSGDGEPTTFSGFTEAVRIAASARSRHKLSSAKLVLLTNAGRLAGASLRQGLDLLDSHGGEIWAKLDAGTEEFFRRVNRPDVPLKKIVDNILQAARTYRVVIQSLWLKMDGHPPPLQEIEAYCGLLNGILTPGGRLQALQVHTVARNPAESYALPLAKEELDRLAATIRARVPVPVEVYYGVQSQPGSLSE